MNELGILMIWLVVALVYGIIFGFIGRKISEDKGRSPTEGFLFGLFLGVIGVIVVALLPANEATISESLLADGTYKKCPYCAEVIKSEALVCKFCGRALPKAQSVMTNDQSLADEIIESRKNNNSYLLAILTIVAGFILLIASIGLFAAR